MPTVARRRYDWSEGSVRRKVWEGGVSWGVLERENKNYQ